MYGQVNYKRMIRLEHICLVSSAYNNFMVRPECNGMVRSECNGVVRSECNGVVRSECNCMVR